MYKKINPEVSLRFDVNKGNAVGRYIKAALAEREMQIKELAEEIGFDRGRLTHILNRDGERMGHPELLRICQALQLSPQERDELLALAKATYSERGRIDYIDSDNWPANLLITHYMEAQGLRQAELAKRLGVTQPTLSHKLSGRHLIRIQDLLAIANELDVPVADLLDEEKATKLEKERSNRKW